MSYDDQDWFQYEYEDIKRKRNSWEDYKPPPPKEKSQKHKSLNGKCKYNLHPDPAFDPHEYLLAEEIRNRTIPDKYSMEIKKYRFGFYRLYGILVRSVFNMYSGNNKEELSSKGYE